MHKRNCAIFEERKALFRAKEMRNVCDECKLRKVVAGEDGSGSIPGRRLRCLFPLVGFRLRAGMSRGYSSSGDNFLVPRCLGVVVRCKGKGWGAGVIPMAEWGGGELNRGGRLGEEEGSCPHKCG